MIPTISPGDYVVYLPDVPIENGDLIIVNDERGRSMLRRYREKNGEKILLSDNPQYAPIKPNDRYRIVRQSGKCLEEDAVLG